jgi:exodeoxyribonuclease V alpha subunit
MNSTTFAPLDLAEGFAAHCAHWAAVLGAPAVARQAVVRAARAVSLATAAGHVCLPLNELAETPAEAAELAVLLLASGVAGRPAEGRRPLVLDPQGRLYLRRYFDYERRLAGAIVTRLGEPSAFAGPDSSLSLRERVGVREGAPAASSTSSSPHVPTPPPTGRSSPSPWPWRAG